MNLHKRAILLVNLGSPDAPDTASVRRYLAEFLADPRIVEAPRLLWLPVLHGIILRTRPRRSAKAYQSIWTEAGSPLVDISRRQAAALAQHFDDDATRVALAMRYGNPSVASVLRELREWGMVELIVLPMYPQYSATTSASVFDAVIAELRSWRDLPELHCIRDYHRDAGYIEALATSVRRHWQEHGQGQLLLMSFHGIPREYVDRGDPYRSECERTGRLLADQLGLRDDQWQLTFQSRFGPKEWLQPYTDETLGGLPGRGIKRIDVICPGFSADCLETLEEMNVENREHFLHAGGEHYGYIPCLNDDPLHIDALARLIERRLRS